MTGGSPEATGTPRSPESAIDATRFAHASEAEMARILDFYQVRWEYEPTTFPILWNLDGDVIESFAPDFFLPDLEVFLEMTTLRQRLVRKKNRKLRRLRELYPDVKIKLFYARDFRAMMLKYGRLGLARSLSGTSGQVVPDRVAAAAGARAPESNLAVPDRTPASAADEPALPASAASIQEPIEALAIAPDTTSELEPSAAQAPGSEAGSPGPRRTGRARRARRRRSLRSAEMALAEQEGGV